jgi:hypothetical protein
VNPNFNLLTPWRRVLLKKLLVTQLSQEIPRLSWNPKVYYHVDKIRHCFLSWPSRIQSAPSHALTWRYFLILSSNIPPRLQSGFFELNDQKFLLISNRFLACYICRPSHLPNSITQAVFGEERNYEYPNYAIFSILGLLPLSWNIVLSILISKHPPYMFLP